jgi:HSP20 family protein
VPEGRSVGAQLVGDQQFRRETLLPQQLAHQPERRALVAPALNQHIEDLALMIDGAPQVHPLAGDSDDHLVEVPPIARARAGPPEPSCNPGSEFQHPAPYRLIGDIEPALGKQILHIAIAQGEPEVQPDRVLDDRRRKAMSAIREMGHARTLSDQLLPGDPVAVTMPPDMWQPFRNEMNRFSGFGMPALRRWFETEPNWSYQSSFTFPTPAIDVTEDDKAFKITAELPGLDQKDIDVTVANGTLTIKGEKSYEKEDKNKDRHVSERAYGSFQRSFAMPDGVDSDNIAADLAKGVLTITLPKTMQAQKQQKIEVKAAA